MGAAYNVSRSAGSYIAFSANITYYDASGRSLILYPGTELEACPISNGAISQQSSSMATTTMLANNSTVTSVTTVTRPSVGWPQLCGPFQWLLGNVTEGVVHPLLTGVLLPKEQRTTLYFIESMGGIPNLPTALTPFFFIVHGGVCEPNTANCNRPFAMTLPVASVSWNKGKAELAR